jgi:hypothetical protein
MMTPGIKPVKTKTKRCVKSSCEEIQSALGVRLALNQDLNNELTIVLSALEQALIAISTPIPERLRAGRWTNPEFYAKRDAETEKWIAEGREAAVRIAWKSALLLQPIAIAKSA